MKNLKRARSAFKRALFVLFGFSMVVNLLMLTMPFYMLQIYERVLPSRSNDTLMFLSIIAVAALVVLGALEAVRSVVASRAAARLETDLGADTLRASILMGRQSGSDIQLLRDLSMVRSFIGSRGVFALLDAPFAPIFIILLWFLHPLLFWLTVVGAAILLMLAVLNQWVTSKQTKEAVSEQSRAMRTATAMVENEETLRAMGMTDNGVTVWGKNNAEALIAQDSVDVRNAVLAGISRTIRMILQIAILGVGGWLALRNEISPGVIFASSIIAGRGLQPIDQIIGAWKQSTLAWNAWVRLRGFMERMPDPAERTILPEIKGQISVDTIRVMPPKGSGDEPILKNLSFEIPQGDMLGIVGPSGSGKSTLARLLVGAQVPDHGVVRIDGTDIQNWDDRQIGNQIGYLSQEVRLFPGTVKENIARMSEAPDDNLVLEAARKAQVHELIQSLPQGYDTFVGPGGYKPSVGQRQRIALARAFYGNPRIMVLDEPNANLDDDGQLALRLALRAARENGATVIVVTQRKQVLTDMANIMRLHAGTIDFHGSNQEFVAALRQLRERKESAVAEQQRKLRENALSAAGVSPSANTGGGKTDGAAKPTLSMGTGTSGMGYTAKMGSKPVSGAEKGKKSPKQDAAPAGDMPTKKGD
ncbi:type I secretion system permease/ATPase [Pseudahrensia aquimaris]|uniref:Type I secretion system permease/ATPase n=1 Tax=Pseudahrensia aquimaris TaxID=744461 RepID=A0ABW3FHW8_9HYPH